MHLPPAGFLRSRARHLRAAQDRPSPRVGAAPPAPLTSAPPAAARDIVTTPSPFTSAPTWPCEVCKRTGHAQYECQRRLFITYNRPLPGFLPLGEFDPFAWFQGTMLPATRATMAAYLTELHIQPHRKLGVTTAHILASTAPPPLGP